MAAGSCVTNLIDTLNYVGSSLDSGGHIDMIYMDMPKAFDKVYHGLLIEKLQKDYGFEVNPSVGSSAILKIANKV